ncbi:hypothetical protein C1646_799443 [Rhizophagus diaphanus]|nr:hypothetical protein C1646_799443 [Rhizophagus diaphanus] [Rhizophagus sp. MUCL 43196]
MPAQRKKTVSIATQMNQYPGVFKEDNEIMFCKFCDLSVEWKSKSIIDGHCLLKSHIKKKQTYESNAKRQGQVTISNINAAFESRKEVIEDLIEAFSLANIPLEKINNLLPFFKKYLKEEYEKDKNNESVLAVNGILQDVQKRRTVTIYINFIACFVQEFVQDLDFFQQQNKPVFPFVEGHLEQLTSYLEGNCIAQNFGPELHSLITQLYFNPDDFYSIFRSAFNSAYTKFEAHIPQHPVCSLFCASRVFDPLYIKMGIQTGDLSRNDIRRYSIITKFCNLSDELL